MTTPDPAPSPTSGLSRRRLLTTGAHAAWAVPTVAVVAAAPAVAATGDTTLTSTVLTATGGVSSAALTVTSRVTNSGTSPATTVRVTYLLTPAAVGGGDFSRSTYFVNGTGPVQGTPDGTSVRFTFTDVPDVGVGGSHDDTRAFQLAPTPGAGNVTVTFSAANAPAASSAAQVFV